MTTVTYVCMYIKANSFKLIRANAQAQAQLGLKLASLIILLSQEATNH